MPNHYDTDGLKTQGPPRVGQTPPRNDFGPREALAALDTLSRRRAAQVARLSPVTRLRGVQ